MALLKSKFGSKSVTVFSKACVLLYTKDINLPEQMTWIATLDASIFVFLRP